MPGQTKKIAIIGAGGHAKVIASSILNLPEFELLGFVSEFKKTPDETIFDLPIFTTLEEVPDYMSCSYIVGLGDNQKRAEIFADLKNKNLNLESVIDPTVTVAQKVDIGTGTFIAPRAIINTHTKIGENCILNTGTIIEHDSEIGDHTHVAPGVRAAGKVKIGEYSFVGIGSSIKDGINIGSRATVGAGSVVIGDVPDDATVAGVPAKNLHK